MLMKQPKFAIGQILYTANLERVTVKGIYADGVGTENVQFMYSGREGYRYAQKLLYSDPQEALSAYRQETERRMQELTKNRTQQEEKFLRKISVGGPS